VRRVHLAGRPYGIAIDRRRERLWITLTARNAVVELPAHGRPRILRRFPTVRQPNTVAVDELTGRVFVAGRSDGTLQLLDPPDAP
jgi:DNA-binding beta-propeller fold protein YncE